MNVPTVLSGSSRAAVLALLTMLAAHGVEAQVSLEASTSAGVLVGTSREIVLFGTYIESELDWAMQPLAFTGSELRVSAPTGLRASLEVRSGIPGKTGRITDRDFLNNNGVVTHYSEHDCFTEGALLLDARLGWRFALGRLVDVEPFAGFSLMRYKWTARDGFLQYPPEAGPLYTPWDPQAPRIRVYGTGIVYQQTWYIPVAGVRATIRLSDRLDVGLSLGFSPFLWMNDLDNHELRLLDFVGTLSGGFLLDPSLDVSWRLADRARLSLDLSYRAIRGLVGDTLIIGTGVGVLPGPGGLAPGEWNLYQDSAGASFDSVGIALSLELSL